MTRDRAQLVLAVAALAAVALLPVVAAYLQLGYAGDLAAADAYERPSGDVERALTRSVQTAAPRLAREHRWRDRREAAAAFRRDLAPRLRDLRGASPGATAGYAVAYNATAAADWRAANCPRGDGRRFGGCRALGGVVVQNRAGRAHVLAAAFDVTVVTPDGTWRTSVVIRRR